jgi:hypothetical protein
LRHIIVQATVQVESKKRDPMAGVALTNSTVACEVKQIGAEKMEVIEGKG